MEKGILIQYYLSHFWISNIAIVSASILLIAFAYSIFLCYKRNSRSATRQNIKLSLPPDENEYYDTLSLNYIELTSFFANRKNEIELRFLQIGEVIGKGEFGNVHKGTYTRDGENILVALKSFSGDLSESNKRNFLIEVSNLSQFDHRNIIQLFGVVTLSTPIFMVSKYMENGTLDEYLRNHQSLQKKILMQMMLGIASGMHYLTLRDYIHRKLSARNILLDKSLTCKICDFGLPTFIEKEYSEDSYSLIHDAAIPLRWMALETLLYTSFSHASDVWSFGIVCWEIMTYGRKPYFNWSNSDIVRAIETGYRLPPPYECPQIIYNIMLSCWQKNIWKRPNFRRIVCLLSNLSNDISTLQTYANTGPCNPLIKANKYPSNSKRIDDFLVYIHMERFIPNFENAEIKQLSDLAKTNFKSLEEMGVNNLEDKTILINAIECLRE